ncbi:hypothetical protein [Streptomyces sp.]|uniref:hypothetical protein n=1 Tax=Streptomyces sp. TaxID=1931 RepID=UPI002F3F473A
MTVADAETGAGAPNEPTDYWLMLPDGWFRIDLDSERRAAAVAALVERQFQGLDDAPLLKAQAREELAVRAEEAYRNGGIELYLSLQAAGPLTVPAALLITLVPSQRPGATAPEDLAAYLSEHGPVGQEISVEELPTGRAVRVRTRSVPAPDDPSGNTLPVTSVDYRLPVPGTEAYLLLSFSTPLDPVADAMADLFDAVALSFRWM